MRWRSLFLRASAACLGLGVAAGLVELVLHWVPAALPAAYRATYPLHGIEFFAPGILGRTPVEGVPLPLVDQAYDGPAPADLITLGIAPATAADATPLHRRNVVPADARGLPNVRALDRADVLLLGDSFVYGMGATTPEMLASKLGRALARPVYDLGVTGAGPQQEAYLLEHLGLALQPRVVVWFVFGGNDLTDAERLETAITGGARTIADRDPQRPPRWILPDLLAWYAAKVRFGEVAHAGETPPQPHPGVLLVAPGRGFRAASAASPRS